MDKGGFMKKLFIGLSFLTILVWGQEIGVYGNRGMFRVQYAEPHNMGVFAFNLGASERYENLQSLQGGVMVTDHKHYVKINAGLSYSIIDYIETRFRVTPFMKWFEMTNYPLQRGDPDPVIGIETFEWGMKLGVPVVVDKVTPVKYAFGIDGFVDWGPELSKQMFSNAWYRDKAFYDSSFTDAGATPVFPHFAPYIPHDPDIGITGLFDFRIGPFATHLNVGYLSTGIDHNPGYVLPGDFRQRPNYVTHGGGIELIPSEDIRLLFEAFGYYNAEMSSESLWVTPGVRFGAKSVSFDVGIDLGIQTPSDSFYWKVFFNFSGGADLITKQEIHIPVAKITGKVYDAKTGDPVNGTITFPGSDKEAIPVAQSGIYEISLTPGVYRIHVEAPNYRWKEQGVTLKDGDNMIFDFALNKKEISKVLGKIYDVATKMPIVANISFPQTSYPVINSDTSGMYNAVLGPGNIRVHVEATGYQFEEKVITLAEGESRVLDIGMTKVSLDQSILVGKVEDADSAKPLLAQITFVDAKIPTATTDPTTGIFKMTVPPGTYSVKVEAQDYIMETTPVVMVKDETKIQNFKLKRVPKVGEKIILRGIYFDFNSATIKPESYPVLDDAAKVLTARPNMRVEIGGHTDSIGSDSYNMELSYSRANSVRDYLIRYHQVDPSRLIARGYGETMPIADNRTKSGRDMNRRIEFMILSQ
jgi:outer membrane protein OmpA-like peptidoglycan-associated protein